MNNLTETPKMTSEMVESTWASICYFLQFLDPDITKMAKGLLECLYLKI